MRGEGRLRIIDFVRGTNVVQSLRYFNTIKSHPNELLIEIQKKNLTDFLIKIRDVNKFYRDILLNFSPATIKKDPYSVLQLLPIVDKNFIKDHFELMLSNPAPRYEEKYTGGSSGEPFRFRIDSESIGRLRAFDMFMWNHSSNFSLNDNILVIGGNSLGKNRKILSIVYNYLQRRTFFDGQVIVDTSSQKLYQLLRRLNIKYIYGYPSSIRSLIDAMHLEDKLVDTVFTTSETLPANLRKELEDRFCTTVIDVYGAHDGGIVADECQVRNGFHQNSTDCYVEPMLNKECGRNELVITNLFSFSLPFIRYKVGDLGEINYGNCSCGVNFPRIYNLTGRTRDLLRLKNGNSLHGSVFNDLFYGFSEIDQYQVIRKNGHLKIVLKVRKFDDTFKMLIINKLKRLLDGEDFVVLFDGVFQYSKNSKFKSIIDE
ncbi:MAG: hypothetical protein FMNOHCHN_00351 [Ignavibacteriaceae bacterium]|nr:hypothetical protein [Ignavibacteriaceae bacterium]